MGLASKLEPVMLWHSWSLESGRVGSGVKNELMDVTGKRIILTGAGGAIGRALTGLLHAQGAQLLLTGRNMVILNELLVEFPGSEILGTDLATEAGCSKVVNYAIEKMGGIDILVNLAGLGHFCDLREQSPKEIQTLINANLYAPILLSKFSVDQMIKQDTPCMIVNIGSIIGSVGSAWHSTYAATKFGLRGFSESLRREVYDRKVHICYIGPRAVSSANNLEHVQKMMEKVCLEIDTPEYVAKKILMAIHRNKKEYYIGFVERLLVLMNFIFPSLCDIALKYVSKAAKQFLQRL